jgi:anti-anti-sigma factor
MPTSESYLDVNREGDVCRVRLRKHHFDEAEIHELGDELINLAADDRCRSVQLYLGPKSLECLYSVFLAKLVSLRRRIEERGGTLKLCDVTPDVLGVFEACRLKDFFDFELN